MFKISAILCTHNPRADYLNRVLKGIQAQDLPQEDWEFLFVDNASPMLLASSFDLSWHPNARHIREDRLGVACARSRAIQESSANLLIFIDDDAVLDPDYFRQALAIGEECPFIGSWGGNCVPEFEAAVPSWVPETVWRLTVMEVKRDVWSNLTTFETTPAGAGLCCRRTVGELYVQRLLADTVRSSNLDRKGTGLAGYGDIDLAHCALDLGLGLGLFTRLRLTHLIRASRLSIDYLARHAEADVASYMMFCAIRGYPVEKPKPMSALGKFRWFLKRVVDHVPRETYQMQKASRRGAEKGYAAVQEYLQSVAPK